MTILSGEGLSKAALVEDMSAEGFKCYESSLGGDGVLWHGETVPPEFEEAAAAAASELREGGNCEGSGWVSTLLASRNGKRMGIAAAAAVVAVAVAAVVPAVFSGSGRRGSRW